MEGSLQGRGRFCFYSTYRLRNTSWQPLSSWSGSAAETHSYGFDLVKPRSAANNGATRTAYGVRAASSPSLLAQIFSSTLHTPRSHPVLRKQTAGTLKAEPPDTNPKRIKSFKGPSTGAFLSRMRQEYHIAPTFVVRLEECFHATQLPQIEGVTQPHVKGSCG
jgi:hypothetical protein